MNKYVGITVLFGLVTYLGYFESYGISSSTGWMVTIFGACWLIADMIWHDFKPRHLYMPSWERRERTKNYVALLDATKKLAKLEGQRCDYCNAPLTSDICEYCGTPVKEVSE